MILSENAESGKIYEVQAIPKYGKARGWRNRKPPKNLSCELQDVDISVKYCDAWYVEDCELFEEFWQ